MTLSGSRPNEAELLIARNHALAAVAVLPDEPRIMAGVLLSRRDIEVLLAFTDSQAAEVEHRVDVMSSRPAAAISERLQRYIRQFPEFYDLAESARRDE